MTSLHRNSVIASIFSVVWTFVAGRNALAERRIVPASISETVRAISESEMQRVYDEVKTPYKYGVVLEPASKDEYFDCPNVFRHGDKWYMLYVAIKDKVGYGV